MRKHVSFGSGQSALARIIGKLVDRKKDVDKEVSLTLTRVNTIPV